MDEPEPRTALSEALAALADGREGSVVVAASVDTGALDWDGSRVPDAELPARLSGPVPPAVLVVSGVGARLTRALRRCAPALVVVTGPATPALPPSIHVLGPSARVRRGPGRVLLACLSEEELAGYTRALGDDLALGLAPSPGWLPAALGLLDARGWALWAQIDVGALPSGDPDTRAAWAATAHAAAARPDAWWVPAGVSPSAPPGDDPARWWPVCLAGALERRTGPIFPSPRVAALLLAGARPGRRAPAPWQTALYAQAARALPELSRALAPNQPPAFPLDAPGPALLAEVVARRAARGATLAELPQPSPPRGRDDGRADEVLAGAGMALSEHESKVVLRAAGLCVTRQAVATSASAAAAFAERIGFPVALKVASPDLRRKEDIGAVALALPNASAVRRAYGTVLRAVETAAPTARVDGVIVAEMVAPGLDLRVRVRRLFEGTLGVRVDLVSGPVSSAPVFDLLPLDWQGALLLAERVLTGTEGRTRRAGDPAPERLAPVFVALFELWRRTGDRLVEIELDPVRMVPDRPEPVVLDARIRQRAHLEGM